MKISLRKASALQDSITQKMGDLDLTARISLSEFDDAKSRITDSHSKLVKNVNGQFDLYDVYYEIRKDLGHINQTAGVSDRLANIAKLDKKIAVLVTLSNSINKKTDDEVITGHLNKMKTSTSDTNSYYEQRNLTTGLLVESELDEYKSQIDFMRKQKVLLNDEILSLNIKNEIVLSQHAVNILTIYNLI